MMSTNDSEQAVVASDLTKVGSAVAGSQGVFHTVVREAALLMWLLRVERARG